MDYTIATTKSVHGGYSIDLCANGKYRYIVLNDSIKKRCCISEKLERDEATERYWKVAQLIVEHMYGWSDWVEMIAA